MIFVSHFCCPTWAAADSKVHKQQLQLALENQAAELRTELGEQPVKNRMTPHPQNHQPHFSVHLAAEHRLARYLGGVSYSKHRLTMSLGQTVLTGSIPVAYEAQNGQKSLNTPGYSCMRDAERQLADADLQLHRARLLAAARNGSKMQTAAGASERATLPYVADSIPFSH